MERPNPRSFEPLRRATWEQLGDGIGTIDHAKQLASLAQGRRRRRLRYAWTIGAALATASAGIAAVFVWSPPRIGQDERELACRVRGGSVLESGNWIRSEKAPLTLDFDGGSHVQLSADSRIQLVRSRTDAVDVALASGRLRSTIIKDRTVRWTFVAGPYRVRVVGTLFELAWDGERRVEVAVARGRVSVSGGNIRQPLVVGPSERLEARIEDEQVHVVRADARGRLDMRVPGPDAGPSDAATPARDAGGPVAPPASPRGGPARQSGSKVWARWKALAGAGDYRGALKLARRAGLQRLLRYEDGWDLLLLADAARYANDAETARTTLKAVEQRFRHERPGKVALFRLGRLAFDQQRYEAAVRWFGLFVRRHPSDALAADAVGRSMLTLQLMGDLPAARRRARHYLERYPTGSYRAAAKALLSGDRR